MPARPRSLATVALLAMTATVALAQQSSAQSSSRSSIHSTTPRPPQQPNVAPVVPDLPTPPSATAADKDAQSISKDFNQDFGQSMGAWGDSLGRALGALGDSLGRLGTELGAVERRAGGHPSDRDRAEIDSLRSAMNAVSRNMAGGRRILGHNWRDVARRARDAARQAGRSTPGHTGFTQLIDRARRDPEGIALPSADSFAVGGLTIPAGTVRAGTAATVNGNLDVYGMVAGNAVAVGGNVEVHPGAHVAGTAFAAGGEVHVDSGALVDGEVRSVEGDFGAVPVVGRHAIAPTSTRWHAVRLTIATFALLLVLGIGVLTFAEDQLNNVTATLANRFGRSMWYGILGEIALGPALLVIIVGLAITVVGVVVLPFAIVGYGAIAVGAATLGFVAVAEATGTTMLRAQSQATLTPRGAQLRAIVAGVGGYGALWLVTLIIGAESGVAIAVRILAVVVTAVAMTVGFGAVILWRFEIRRAGRLAAAATTPADEAVWQTPTPVAGVAAARRPTPASTSSAGKPT